MCDLFREKTENLWRTDEHIPIIRGIMVGVAQLVELRIVIPAVVGSNPIVHPNSVFVAHVHQVSRAARALFLPQDDKDLRQDRYPKRVRIYSALLLVSINAPSEVYEPNADPWLFKSRCNITRHKPLCKWLARKVISPVWFFLFDAA